MHTVLISGGCFQIGRKGLRTRVEREDSSCEAFSQEMSHLVGIGNQYLDSLLAPECYEICAASYLVNVRDMGVQ